jgi:phage gp29-like protein
VGLVPIPVINSILGVEMPKTMEPFLRNAPPGISLAAARKQYGDPPKLAPSAAASTPITQSLSRILRPQAAYRWLLPQLAAITPQYIEMVLRGALAGSHVQAWELFDLMEDSSPRLVKNINELKLAVLNRVTSFNPFQEENEEATDSAKEKTSTVSAALRGMNADPCADENNLSGTIYDLMDAWCKGTTVLEINWEARQSKKLGRFLAPKSTYWVHPVCYAWDMDGRLGLRNELTANGGVNPSLSPGVFSTTTYQPRPSSVSEFPEHKFLIAICKAKSGTALGGARLRSLAWWWCAANFSADWLLNLAQLFGLPFRWANYDPSAPQATVDAICTMLENMGHNAWAAFPAGTTLELKDSAKSGENSPQSDLLDRCEKQMDLLILGQTLTTDTGGMGAGGGSKALGEVHAGVKAEIVNAASDWVCGILTDQLARSVVELNYGEASEVPSVKLQSIEEEDLKTDSDIINNLVTAGFGKRIGLDWLGAKFRIPKPAEGEETLEAPQVEEPADPNAPPAAGPENGKTGLKGKADPSSPNLDAEAEKQLLAAVAPDADLLNRKLAALMAISDPQLFLNRAADLKGWLDANAAHFADNPAVQQVLEQTLAAALANGLAANPSGLKAAFNPDQARDDTGKWAESSLGAYAQSGRAMSSSSEADHQAAATAHTAASKLHGDLAAAALSEGRTADAEFHKQKAEAHATQSEAHVGLAKQRAEIESIKQKIAALKKGNRAAVRQMRKDEN